MKASTIRRYRYPRYPRQIAADSYKPQQTEHQQQEFKQLREILCAAFMARDNANFYKATDALRALLTYRRR
jgi:hypothetical protein